MKKCFMTSDPDLHKVSSIFHFCKEGHVISISRTTEVHKVMVIKKK